MSAPKMTHPIKWSVRYFDDWWWAECPAINTDEECRCERFDTHAQAIAYVDHEARA